MMPELTRDVYKMLLRLSQIEQNDDLRAEIGIALSQIDQVTKEFLTVDPKPKKLIQILPM